MTPLRGRRGGAVRAIAVGLLALAAAPATASAGTNHNLFDNVSFSEDANGVETPYTSAAKLIKSVSYNSAGFDLEADEINPDRTGCATGPSTFDAGGRSGWVRFLPGVAGTVRYDVTSTYDSIIEVWTSDNPARGAVRPSGSPPTFANVDCNSARREPGGEFLTGIRTQPNKPLWLQTLGYCGTGGDANAACPGRATTAAPGGPTTVQITFTPDNKDGDAVPDTLDACKDDFGTAANGCPVPTGGGPGTNPDVDGDGVLDSVDRCKGLKGTAARHGCPPGLRNDPSIDYYAAKGGIQVVRYRVRASKGARVVVTCSSGCKRTVVKGRGNTRVRISGVSGRRLKNGTKITVVVSLRGRLTTKVIDRVSNREPVEGGRRCYFGSATRGC